MVIPIIVINLKEKENDLIRTYKELYKLGALSNNIIRQDATNVYKAQKLKHNYISWKAEENIKHVLSTLLLPTWASVGCAISHIKTWEYIKNVGLKYALIVEDDIKINDINKFKYSLEECMRFLEDSNKYENIFISLNSKTRNETISVFSENIKNYYHQFTGTSCYFVNNSCANYLLNNLGQISYQIDIEISRLFIKPLYNSIMKNNIAGIYKNSGIVNYDHISSVQYHFITLQKLKNCIQQSKFYLSTEIIEIIYQFLPNYNDIYINHYFYEASNYYYY